MNAEDRKRLDEFEVKIDAIKDNHLTHIYEVLGKLTGKMTVLIPLVLAVLALVGGLYLAIFLG